MKLHLFLKTSKKESQYDYYAFDYESFSFWVVAWTYEDAFEVVKKRIKKGDLDSGFDYESEALLEEFLNMENYQHFAFDINEAVVAYHAG